MAATSTISKVSQHEAVQEKEWVKLFPKQVTDNYTSSVTFIKQLTLVAVSTITYLKDAFPEQSYCIEYFRGLQLKLLRRRCGDELAQFVSDAMQQAFHAFDNKYANELALCFYDGPCSAENLIEYHTFSYSYNDSGASMSIRSGRGDLKCSLPQVKARTVKLLRALSLFLIHNCQRELPVNYDIAIRLYYNEDAPKDYQAPGFRSSEELDHLEATAAEATYLGYVMTPYHNVMARSYAPPRNSGDSDAAEPSDNVPQMTQGDKEEFQESTCTEGSSEAAGPLRCPCGKRDTADVLLVTCQYCGVQQHAACCGLLAARPHCCGDCAAADHTRPVDALLRGLDDRKRQSLCIFRRILELCSRSRDVTGLSLMQWLQLNTANTRKMIRLLQSHYVLPHAAETDLEVPRKINHVRLKLALKRFFQPDDHDTLVDRLVAETAQVSFDPLAEALSPDETESLRNSQLGTVIDPDVTPVTNDPTLQEYREAILSNEDISEELPLSGSHNPVPVGSIGKKPVKRKTADDPEWQPKMPKLRSSVKTKRRA